MGLLNLITNLLSSDAEEQIEVPLTDAEIAEINAKANHMAEERRTQIERVKVEEEAKRQVLIEERRVEYQKWLDQQAERIKNFKPKESNLEYEFRQRFPSIHANTVATTTKGVERYAITAQGAVNRMYKFKCEPEYVFGVYDALLKVDSIQTVIMDESAPMITVQFKPIAVLVKG